MLRSGFSYKTLAHFQNASGLALEQIVRLTGIPRTTLHRRHRSGRLNMDESDRLLRVAGLFEQAVDLFEGDVDAARKWLESPLHALGGEIPLEFATTEFGTRCVERIIGRLEHGVFT